MRPRFIPARLLGALAIATQLLQAPALANEATITVYSSRHHSRDEVLFADFTKTTGISVHRIEGGADDLIEAIRKKPAALAADVLISVDAAPLDRAEQMGLFQPIESKVIETAVPQRLRTKHWSAFSTRATLIIYNKDLVRANEVQTYADLADPMLTGKVCGAALRQPFSRSLVASIMAHEGVDQARLWTQGVVANLAQIPKGNDIDQILAVADGDPCEIALSNTYHMSGLLRSQSPETQKALRDIGIVWPNQKTTGTHFSISGGGVLKGAANRAGAIRFLEFLVSEHAQRYFAKNDDWPVTSAAAASNPVLDALGAFKGDELSAQQLVGTEAPARAILDRAGFR